ncbi:hypothetical protein M406DRAFT_55452 [Cryphonectria parasitica EP155]|uniref:Uncharacterized protein n=1 Tax=Cryphonectria parasitica (strain ATCC 38755 / EP155) TaxID=660469 RepID=A0A9P5CS99_CRYP1|nr:uncharacterized protein M406DRAFT_55452 [Cryphonectria parasitica EP155]KAF3767930.1 hypothetical protein M406DRAFT_55452 [Cryphonectria parasitica EP155]
MWSANSFSLSNGAAHRGQDTLRGAWRLYKCSFTLAMEGHVFLAHIELGSILHGSALKNGQANRTAAVDVERCVLDDASLCSSTQEECLRRGWEIVAVWAGTIASIES